MHTAIDQVVNTVPQPRPGSKAGRRRQCSDAAGASQVVCEVTGPEHELQLKKALEDAGYPVLWDLGSQLPGFDKVRRQWGWRHRMVGAVKAGHSPGCASVTMTVSGKCRRLRLDSGRTCGAIGRRSRSTQWDGASQGTY